MSWVFGVLAGTAGLILLWGLFSPRTQWRALEAWSVTDRYRDEPGGGSYGLRRLLCGIGAAGVAIVLAVSSVPAVVATVPTTRRVPDSVITQLWGKPDPEVVNRIISPLASPPGGLVEMPIIAYEDLSDDVPEFFDALRDYELLGDAEVPGYIGRVPDVGATALGSATIAVQVRGPLLCIPRAAVVVENEETITIGIYYGLPDAPAGTVVDNTVSCPTDEAVTGSVLIPLELNAPIGTRTVIAIDGTAIREVTVPIE